MLSICLVVSTEDRRATDRRTDGQTDRQTSCDGIILHSIILAANLVFDQVCSQVFDKFVRFCDTLSTSFRLYCRKPDREPQKVRLVVRVLDKWNVEKKPILSKFTTGFQHAFDLHATRFAAG